MGTYPNRNPMMPEANNTEASFRQFAWINPGNFFPATKINFSPFQVTQMNPKSGIAAIPIRSHAPMAEPTKNSDAETNPTKVKKKKPSPKVLSPKQPKKKPSASKKAKGQSKVGANVERKNLNTVFDEASLDFSGVPPPFCSCTGFARGCYKWGAGGWQSSCCNSSISEYPLPMSSSRPGSRLAGRKMSNGAYRKVLYKLVTGDHDLSHAVDLKDHWAKHGTNKFVTIK